MPKHYSYLNNPDFFQEAYKIGKLQVIEPNNFVLGGIIPHHLLVKDKIAAFFLGLEKYNYQTIILIGPDHFNKTTSEFTTSSAVWETPYGLLEPDLNLIENLSEQKIIIDELPFGREHSISGLVSFIKKSFPQAKFVPILVNKSSGQEAAQNLGKILSEQINAKNTLVLASVDFSHDYPTKIADEHDIISNQVIQDFSFNDIYQLDLDSPTAIYTLLKYLEISGSISAQHLWQTNSGRIMNKMNEASTSHNFYYFTR